MNSKKGKKHLGNPVLKFILTVNYLISFSKSISDILSTEEIFDNATSTTKMH